MTRKSRSSTTRGSRTVSTMASAKLCPCATAAKGLHSSHADRLLSYICAVDFIEVSSSDELGCPRTRMCKD